jgi:hypothetical protein
LAFEPNKEINGLTFASVGRNTIVDHVQVSYSNDDSYEWFGGTVNCKHLISFKTTDDDFDTDFGYTGAVQFGIAFKDSQLYDMSWNAPSGASTSETFESDNDASGSGRLPLTSAVFSNMTCVGPVPAGMTWSQLTTAQKGAFRRGARIRRNSRLSIVNSIFMGYRNFVMFDYDGSKEWLANQKRYGAYRWGKQEIERINFKSRELLVNYYTNCETKYLTGMKIVLDAYKRGRDKETLIKPIPHPTIVPALRPTASAPGMPLATPGTRPTAFAKK